MSYIGNPIISTDFPKDTFSGNGATVAFTMSIAPASVNAVIVVVSGITQDPSTYTISGTTLTFSAAPPTGTSNISVRHLGVAGIPNTPSAGSVVTASIADSNVTTAKIADANVTQAKLASGIAGTGPAFSAYQSSSQTIATNTTTKVQFQTEEFDTANAFDSTTNYRFTPQVAGYYQVTTSVGSGSGFGSDAEILLAIAKNGSVAKYLWDIVATAIAIMNGTALIYLNGSTDYIEVFFTQYSGSNKSLNANSQVTYFQAELVRAA